MIKLTNADLLFEKQPVYRVLTSKSALSATPHKVIIVYRSAAAELPASQKEMLEKLVVACKYKVEDVVYVNTGISGEMSLGVLKATYSPEVVLVFGEVKVSHNLPALKRNQPFELNGLKVLQAEELDKLHSNAKEKGVLWVGLQKMMAL